MSLKTRRRKPHRRRLLTAKRIKRMQRAYLAKRGQTEAQFYDSIRESALRALERLPALYAKLEILSHNLKRPTPESPEAGRPS